VVTVSSGGAVSSWLLSLRGTSTHSPRSHVSRLCSPTAIQHLRMKLLSNFASMVHAMWPCSIRCGQLACLVQHR
jgi:hypothetical protein